jgi:hypothetical protein
MASEPGPYDRLAEAAAQVAAARAADKDAFMYAGVAGVVVFFWLSGSEYLGEAWAVPAVVVAFAVVYRVAKVVLYRNRGLGRLPLFGSLLPSSVPLSDGPADSSGPEGTAGTLLAPEEPPSAYVPRLAFTRTPPDAAIILAKHVAVDTLRAGRANTPSDDLPLGVLLVTSDGLAFLPEARDHLENLIGDVPAGLVGKLAGQLLPPVERLQAMKDVLELYDSPPPLSEWILVALKQKHAFVIGWGDLVGVHASPASLVLTRRNDAEETSFKLLTDGSQLVTGLMQCRIAADLQETVLEFVLRPRFQELLPQVEAELAASAPGKDAAELKAQAQEVAGEQTMRWFSETTPALEDLVREKMQPALAGYAQLPGVVAHQPWLFAAGRTAGTQ